MRMTTVAPASGWKRWLPRMALGFIDQLYPPLCIACGEVTGTPATLCAGCWRRTPFISRPFCERLGSPFAVDLGGPLFSPQAIADPPAFRRARAVALHDGPARVLAHRLKYNDRLDLAAPMAAMMRAAGTELFEDAELIIPVPLHWTRLFARRFNQSALLAQALELKEGPRYAPDILKRRKRTISQVGLTRDARRANLQGAFVVMPDDEAKLTGRGVVLVDDVLTTGSTANAAARILLKAGARHVDVLTFARVVTTA